MSSTSIVSCHDFSAVYVCAVRSMASVATPLAAVVALPVSGVSPALLVALQVTSVGCVLVHASEPAAYRVTV